MGDEELLSMGRFARLSGLSIGALRHYHEQLLAPRAWPETLPKPDAAAARARQLAADIAEQEDRELLLSDLATVERSG